MSAQEVRLRSGAMMRAECLAAPLDEADAAPLAALVNNHLEEPFLLEMLCGRVASPPRVRAMRATLDGRLAGTAWMAVGPTLPELGVIGGVATSPEFRGLGIATALVGHLCRTFDADGGRFLWLATASDVARRIYERLGFRLVAGQLMCRAAPGCAWEAGYRERLPVRARPAAWRDIAALVPLYAWPHECVVVDSGLPHLSTRVAGTRRCVGFFWRTWYASVARGGRWEVMENARGWLVASVVARPAGGRPGRLDLDFVWHPVYERDGRSLLGGFLERVCAGADVRPILWIADDDEWKRRVAGEMGFAPTAERREEASAGMRLSLRSWERVSK